MRKLIAIAAGAVAAVATAGVPGASAAASGGVSPASLSEHGWICILPGPGSQVHCAPPAVLSSTATLAGVMMFDTFDVSAVAATFLGTELLIRGDLYHGQPCPQEGDAEFHDFVFAGVVYKACHHFDPDG